jgi:hypothetical protein
MATYPRTIAGVSISDGTVKTLDEILPSYVSANDYWHDQRLEYSSGDLIYLGKNTTHKALTSATTWEIWKYTWSSGDCTRIEGPLTGAWDNRASLSWG